MHEDVRQLETANVLTHRKLLQSNAIESDLRGTLRNFGLKVGMVGMCQGDYAAKSWDKEREPQHPYLYDEFKRNLEQAWFL